MKSRSDCDKDNSVKQKKYAWMCGFCPGKPTFDSVHDLFSHKKCHNSPSVSINLNASSNTTSDLSLNAIGTKLHSTFDDDDIPLAKLSIGQKDSTYHKSKLAEDNIEKTIKTIRKEVSEPAILKETDVCLTAFDDALLGESFLNNSNDSNYLDDDRALDPSSNSDDNSESNPPNIQSKSDKSKHVCKICHTEFTTRSCLSQHKMSHLYRETGMFKCEKCGKMCQKYDNFARHMTIHEENRKKSFFCELCSSSFYNFADLKKHKVLHMDVKPFTCDHCGEGFIRQDALLVHMGKHTGIQFTKFTCKLCGKIFNSPSSLAMHSKNHTDKNVFCPEPDCEFACYLQSQLRQHLRKHSGEKPYQCSVCGRCFARSNDMKNHMLNVHERVRTREFNLKSTKRSHKFSNPDIRPYLCDECGKSFHHPSTLRKHIQTIHGDACDQYKEVDCEGKKKRRGPKKPVETLQTSLKIVKDEVTYAEIGVQSMPVMTIPIPIHIQPQITFNLEQGFTQAYIIPTVPITTAHAIKNEDS